MTTNGQGQAGGRNTRSGENLAREERLALQLRENLKRRKAQARALKGGNSGDKGGVEG